MPTRQTTSSGRRLRWKRSSWATTGQGAQHAMMRSVFGKTFYDQRWSMGGFAVGLAILNFFILYMYPAVADATEEMMSGMSESVAESLLGSMQLIGTPEAYLN